MTIQKTTSGLKVEQKSYNEDIYNLLLQKHNTTIARILSDRIENIEQIEGFINPKIKNLLPHINNFKDGEVAIELMYNKIQNNEKICIIGDYDVDGSCSTALIINFFQEIGFKNYTFIIPDRVLDGYGPNNKMITEKQKEGVSLFVIVDCGTVAFEPIALAKSMNIDVIVLDHHKSEEKLPNALIVNPNRKDEKEVREDLKYLCACGVVFVFLAGLNQKLTQEKKVDLIKFLPIVAIATVCDVVPLIGVNRAIVKTGLEILNKHKFENENKPVYKLLEIANCIAEKINSYHIGFIIGPMINAGGRIGQSFLGATLLSSKNDAEIEQIAQQLFNFNTERKEIEANILQQIKNQNMEEKINQTGFVLEHSHKWHEGVIGIIASRVKDSFHRLSMIGFLAEESGIVKFSCRSVTGIDIGELIIEALNKQILLKGGGHAMAGGFSIHHNKLNEFSSFLQEKIKTKAEELYQNRAIYYDIAISIDGLSVNMITELENTLEPYGMKNFKPVFLVQNCQIVMYSILKEKHLRILLQDEISKKQIWVVSFNSINTDLGTYIMSNKGKNIDFLADISTDVYNGEKKLNIIIKDCILK